MEVDRVRLHINQDWLCPDWCGSVGWLSSHKLKGCLFNSWPGHMPGLEVLFQVGGVQEANDCFSPSLSPSLPLSLKIKINKIFKKKTGHELIITEAGDRGFGVHYNILCIFIYVHIFTMKLKRCTHFDLVLPLLKIYVQRHLL